VSGGAPSARLRALAGQSAIYGVGPVVARFAGLLLLPIYARHLGTAEVGRVGQMVALVAVGATIAQLGLESRRVSSQLIALQADRIEARSQELRIRGQRFDLRRQRALSILGIPSRTNDLIEQRQTSGGVSAMFAVGKPRNQSAQHIARDGGIERRSFRRAV